MQTHAAASADLHQVNAFRMAGHNLSARLPAGSLLDVAGACGAQNTPPGSALLSLHARVSGLTRGEFERALYGDRSLLQAWSLRAAPTIFPTADRAVFTAGLLPVDDASICAYVGGVEPALEKTGIRAVDAVELLAEALLDALDGRALAKDALGVELAARVERKLDEAQRAAWRLPSWYASGQSLGESVARFLLPVLALRGLCCHDERRGSQAYIRRVDQWENLTPPAGAGRGEQNEKHNYLNSEEGAPSRLGKRPGVRSVDAILRAELVRRYLRCYGPSTARHFAEWAGIGLAQAEESWKQVQGELAPVYIAGKPAWLLENDLARFSAPPAPEGVRFLPPHDPFLQLRDRESLVADPALRREIWRSAGSPGVILVDGQLAGVWRSRKQGGRLKIGIRWAMAVASVARSQVEVEGNGLAAVLDCNQVDIEETM